MRLLHCFITSSLLLSLAIEVCADDVAIYHQKFPPVKYKGVECEQTYTKESRNGLNVSATCYDKSFERQCNFRWNGIDKKAEFSIATYDHQQNDMNKVSKQQGAATHYSEQSKFKPSAEVKIEAFEEVGKAANDWMAKYCGDKALHSSTRIYKQWDFRVNKDLKCEYEEISDKPGFIADLRITCYPRKDNLKAQCNFSESTKVDSKGNITSEYSFDVAYYETQGFKTYRDTNNEKQNGKIPFYTRKQVMEFATKIVNEKCKSNLGREIPDTKSKLESLDVAK